MSYLVSRRRSKTECKYRPALSKRPCVAVSVAHQNSALTLLFVWTVLKSWKLWLHYQHVHLVFCVFKWILDTSSSQTSSQVFQLVKWDLEILLSCLPLTSASESFLLILPDLHKIMKPARSLRTDCVCACAWLSAPSVLWEWAFQT